MRYVALAALMLFACAKGGMSDDTQDIDARAAIDGPVGVIDAFVPPPPVDAFVPPPPPVDAFVPPPPPDAFVPPPPPPDAMVVNPPFCSQNSDCIVPGTCCFVIACVPGTPIGASCLPN